MLLLLSALLYFYAYDVAYGCDFCSGQHSALNAGSQAGSKRHALSNVYRQLPLYTYIVVYVWKVCMCCIVLAVLPLNVAHVNNVDVDFPVNGECAPRTLTAAAVKLLPQQQQQQAQQLLTQTTSIPMLNARQLAAISELALHFNVLLLLFIFIFFLCYTVRSIW